MSIQTGFKKQPLFNYTSNAWEGVNYDRSHCQNLTDIAKLIKNELKRIYPEAVFSITKETYSGGQSLYIHLMKWNKSPFVDPASIDWEMILHQYSNYNYTMEELKNLYNSEAKGYMQVNHYYISEAWVLSDAGKEILSKAHQLSNSFNYNDSDSMIDYFHTNFYSHLRIGKWDKNFELII